MQFSPDPISVKQMQNNENIVSIILKQNKITGFQRGSRASLQQGERCVRATGWKVGGFRNVALSTFLPLYFRGCDHECPSSGQRPGRNWILTSLSKPPFFSPYLLHNHLWSSVTNECNTIKCPPGATVIYIPTFKHITHPLPCDSWLFTLHLDQL